MKTRISLSWLVACGLVAGAVITTNAQNQSITKGTATAQFVSGTVQYTTPDGSWQPLRKGTVLLAGTTVQSATETNSYADLAINNGTAVIRLDFGTTLKLDKMDAVGGRGGDFQTGLDLKQGVILGSVKKLSKASNFDIKVPNGVAGIRGTDIRISSLKLPDGKFEVTFTSVRGEVVASARIPGRIDPETHVLQTGDSWTPGGIVVQVDIAFWQKLIEFINGGIEPPPVPPTQPPVIVKPVSPTH